MAREYVLLRITNLRGVDLSIFDFDYDLSWYAMCLGPDGAVLGRFGGRDADTPAKYQTLSGLRHALESALDRFKRGEAVKVPPSKPIRAEDYSGAVKLPDNACIHCHHIHEFRRDLAQREKRWSLDDVWVYPQPENIGLSLDPSSPPLSKGGKGGVRVRDVQPRSLAARFGMMPDDIVRKVGAVPIASVADVQYALQQAPKTGDLAVVWQRGATQKTGVITLAENWRKTDVSWRWSLKSMSPNPSIIGDDLDPDERKKLGLEPRQLAYRQMNFLTPTARHAGLQANDVIVGLDDRPVAMTARQFETHIRLYYRVGDEIALNVMRGKDRVMIKLKLPE